MHVGVHTSGVAVSQKFISAFSSSENARHNHFTMFKAIGVVIILWYLSHLFTESFASLDSAMGESFETLEVAAVISREHLR